MSASDVMRLENPRTDEYKGILVRFGEVQGPLGMQKAWRVNQLVSCDIWDATRGTHGNRNGKQENIKP